MPLERARRGRDGRRANPRIVRIDLAPGPPHRLPAQRRRRRPPSRSFQQHRQPFPRVELVRVDGGRQFEVVDRLLGLAILRENLGDLEMRRCVGRVALQRLAVGVHGALLVAALAPDPGRVAIRARPHRLGRDDAVEKSRRAYVMPAVPADRRRKHQQASIIRRLLQQVLACGHGLAQPSPPPQAVDFSQSVRACGHAGFRRRRHEGVRLRLTEQI